MKILSFDEIVAADDLPQQEVPCPEWGGAVVVKQLMRDELMEARQASGYYSGDDSKDATEKQRDYDIEILQRAIVEPKLTRKQVEKLFEKSSFAIQRLLSFVWDDNAITAIGTPSAKAADEAELSFREGDAG